MRQPSAKRTTLYDCRNCLATLPSARRFVRVTVARAREHGATCISAYRGTEESTVGISADARSAAMGGWWRPGRCGSPCERVLAADDPAVLDYALHAEVDRGNPAIAVLAIAVLSIGYRPL